jgi:NAD(P)-dependent dehydrogenase (short-subunit alcohol dehydrogenase family)
MDLLDQVALITGGGRNLGKAIALRLARAGAHLVLAGPDEPELHGAAREVEALGRRALAVPTDVSDEASVNALAEAARRGLGPVDVLVNNAGIIGPTAPVASVARADWDRVLAVNLTGAFLCCRAFLPDMLARKRGKIINISSIAGKIAYALRSPYAVSKWGLIGLTLTLAKEVGPHNVQVNAVCPGPIAGERMRGVIERRAAELGASYEEVERSYVETTALKRLVREGDVADAVAFLASPAGDSITGQALDITAGYGL